jgi:flagellar motor switch/type III secretory pathway protein FliN
MAELSRDIVAEVVEACKASATEAAEALGGVLDAEVQLTVGEPGSIETGALPEPFTGPGLAIVLTVGQTGALVLLPESSGLLPDWYANPDATGTSKLATLAQELGMVLLPEDYMPDAFRALKVNRLTKALSQAGVSDGAAVLPLEICREGDGEAKATAWLIWPAGDPGGITGVAPPAAEAPAPAPSEQKTAPPPRPAAAPAAPPKQPATIEALPNYSRSLLRIELPVVVTLARKREPLERIVRLGPGSIIQFDKSCEETLEMEIGGLSVATGEAVKVGDKFGLRINAMILPDERFVPVRKD